MFNRFIGGTIGHVLGADGKAKPVTYGNMVDLLRDSVPEMIQKIEIDLSVAHNLSEYSIAGNQILVDNPNLTSDVYINLNEKETQPFLLNKIQSMKGIFYRFFITNIAGSGTLSIYILRGYDFDIAQTTGSIPLTEWCTKNGYDKSILSVAASLAYGANNATTYAVPAKKTLLISHIMGAWWAANAADADLNQIGIVELYKGAQIIARQGGNGGVNMPFNPPLKFVDGDWAILKVSCWSNHDIAMTATARGYEI